MSYASSIVVNAATYGNGVTDATDHIQDAIDLAETSGVGTVAIPAGTYLVSGTLTLTDCVMVGDGGATARTEIRSSATSGAVVRITGRSCGVKGIKLGATSTRRAASTTTGHGVFIGTNDSPSNTGFTVSRQELSDVLVADQPTDGVHCIGSLEYSRFDNVTAQDCIRHGFVQDGGTVSGYSNIQSPAFIVEWERCRALECGGQAFIITSDGGNGSFGSRMIQPEALGCAWDSTKRLGGSLYQMILTGVNFELISPDVEDQQYANTTTSGGKSRTALATPAKGILRSGYGTLIRHPFLSSLVEGIYIASGGGVEIANPRIFAGTYGVNMNPAITATASVTDITVSSNTTSTTGATDVLSSSADVTNETIDGV